MDHIDEVDHIDQLSPKAMLTTLAVGFLGSSAELERGEPNWKGGDAPGRVRYWRKRRRRNIGILEPFHEVLKLVDCAIRMSVIRLSAPL